MCMHVLRVGVDVYRSASVCGCECICVYMEAVVKF